MSTKFGSLSAAKIGGATRQTIATTTPPNKQIVKQPANVFMISPTGNLLVKSFCCRDSNRFMLRALADEAGFPLAMLTSAADCLEELAGTLRQAVGAADLVVTSGPILKNPNPVIEAGWLSEGAFASPVDFDSYWKGDALRQADKLATDDISQMEYYRKTGYFKDTPQPYADLGEIVAGNKPGREKADERTICINLGLALDDMATAILIYNRAREKGIGTQLPL